MTNGLHLLAKKATKEIRMQDSNHMTTNNKMLAILSCDTMLISILAFKLWTVILVENIIVLRKNIYQTRMHSSRMRTTRSLPYRRRFPWQRPPRTETPSPDKAPPRQRPLVSHRLPGQRPQTKPPSPQDRDPLPQDRDPPWTETPQRPRPPPPVDRQTPVKKLRAVIMTVFDARLKVMPTIAPHRWIHLNDEACSEVRYKGLSTQRVTGGWAHIRSHWPNF